MTEMRVNSYGSFLRDRKSAPAPLHNGGDNDPVDESVSEGEIVEEAPPQVQSVTSDLMTLELGEKNAKQSMDTDEVPEPTEHMETDTPRGSKEIEATKKPRKGHSGKEFKTPHKHLLSHVYDSSLHHTHQSHGNDNGRVGKTHIHREHAAHRNSTADNRPLCRSFPHCKFGNRCHYMHPQPACKFRGNCNRKECKYNHASPRPHLAVQQVSSDLQDITAGLQTVGLNVSDVDPFENFLFALLRDNRTHPHAVFSGVAIVTYFKAVDGKDGKKGPFQARMEHELMIQWNAKGLAIRATHDNVSFRVLATSLGGEIWSFYDANDGGKPYKRVWTFKAEQRKPKLVPCEINQANAANGTTANDSRCEYC